MLSFATILRGLVAGVIGLAVTSVLAQPAMSAEIRIGYQKSSSLTAILKTNGELEKALAPLGITVSWHEFTSGLPLLEAINIGSIDFGADVADSHYLLLAALAKSGLGFKDITPAYLTPADGRAAFVGNNVDAWVAWDPFLTSALHQSSGRILADGSNGLASYKRYYLASAAYADKHGDVLNVIFAKLSETGKWVKAQPKDAATLLAGLWGIHAATVEEANSHRSYQVGAVTGPGLSEQQRIADAFHAEGLIPVKIDTTAIKIWSPKGS